MGGKKTARRFRLLKEGIVEDRRMSARQRQTVLAPRLHYSHRQRIAQRKRQFGLKPELCAGRRSIPEPVVHDDLDQ
jgi:hypothetical protein